MYNWITLLYRRNQHNIVNQLYFNKEIKRNRGSQPSEMHVLNLAAFCVAEKSMVTYSTEGDLLPLQFVFIFKILNSASLPNYITSPHPLTPFHPTSTSWP